MYDFLKNFQEKVLVKLHILSHSALAQLAIFRMSPKNVVQAGNAAWDCRMESPVAFIYMLYQINHELLIQRYQVTEIFFFILL